MGVSVILSYVRKNFMTLSLLKDIDECGKPEANECDTNAVCNNTEGSYVCRCFDGYRGDGENCAGKYFIWVHVLQAFQLKSATFIISTKFD